MHSTIDLLPLETFLTPGFPLPSLTIFVQRVCHPRGTTDESTEKRAREK